MANRPEGKVWQKGLLWSAVALFIGLAYATRNVLLVVWIAMVIMQILVLLRSKKWQGLPALCVVLAVMLLGKTTLCHMAGSLVKNDPDGAATVKLWQDFRAFLDAEYAGTSKRMGKCVSGK